MNFVVRVDFGAPLHKVSGKVKNFVNAFEKCHKSMYPAGPVKSSLTDRKI